MRQVFKKLNTELPYDPAIPLLLCTQKKRKQGGEELKRILVHQRSQLHNWQYPNNGNNQESINRQMDKLNVVSTVKGIVFSYLKE